MSNNHQQPKGSVMNEDKVVLPKSGSVGRSDKMELSDEEIDRVLKSRCCKKCFGRGFVGWDLDDRPVMCSCTWKRYPPVEAGYKE